MGIKELKEKFKEIVDLLAVVRTDKCDVVKLCLELFKKGAVLYDELPSIEQALASLHAETSEDVIVIYKVIGCIEAIGRKELNKVAEFKPVNLAKQGEETNAETIFIAWVNLQQLDAASASNTAMKNVLKDRLDDMYLVYRDVYDRLEKLSRCKDWLTPFVFLWEIKVK